MYVLARGSFRWLHADPQCNMSTVRSQWKGVVAYGLIAAFGGVSVHELSLHHHRTRFPR